MIEPEVDVPATSESLALSDHMAPQPLGSAGGRKLPAILPAALVLIGSFVVWEVIVRAFHIRPIILPTPTSVFATLFDRWDVLWPNALYTAYETLLGFGLAIFVGVAFAVVIASSRVLRLALYPLLVMSQAIPVIAIAPLLVIWFGFGITSKVLVAALIAFFPVVVSTAAGLTSLDEGVVNLMRSFPASRFQIFIRARVPNALPEFFSGARVAAVFSVVGAVVGEWVGSDRGLGSLIIRSNARLATDMVFAAIILLAVTGVSLFAAVGVIERLALPWIHRKN